MKDNFFLKIEQKTQDDNRHLNFMEKLSKSQIVQLI